MAKHMVVCLVCGETFDADVEPYEKSGRRYMHKKCAEENRTAQVYLNDIHSYISHIYGDLYVKSKIDKQIKEMLDAGKTLEGINKSLKYWYTIKKSNPADSYGSIRIVNYIYQEALDYYAKIEENKQLNKDIDSNVILNPEVQEFNISPIPIKKPKRVQLFDIQ